MRTCVASANTCVSKLSGTPVSMSLGTALCVVELVELITYNNFTQLHLSVLIKLMTQLWLHDFGDTTLVTRLWRQDSGNTTSATRLRQHDSGNTTSSTRLRRHDFGDTTSATRLRRHYFGNMTSGTRVTCCHPGNAVMYQKAEIRN